ncbi:hypothetical protein BBP40_006871 [Aspergillus hancockii]|nr:hypothetical protein BBP40_006871 [Aspergillus hancockii]
MIPGAGPVKWGPFVGVQSRRALTIGQKLLSGVEKVPVCNDMQWLLARRHWVEHFFCETRRGVPFHDQSLQLPFLINARDVQAQCLAEYSKKTGSCNIDVGIRIENLTILKNFQWYALDQGCCGPHLPQLVQGMLEEGYLD